MYFTYVIEDEVNLSIYIGQTENLQKRIDRHNGILKNKPTSYTSKASSSWKYIHVECYPDRKSAILRERQLKSYQGRKFLEQFRTKEY